MDEGLQHELMFSGPTSVCTRYLGWELAVAGLDELRAIAGPLRIRYASDHNWRPGCWLKSDHDTAAAEGKLKRGLFAKLGSK
jgi:hypothetical protein